MLSIGLSLWQPSIYRSNSGWIPPVTPTPPEGGTPSIRTLSFATTNYGTEHDVYLPEDVDVGRTVFMFITISGTDTIQLPEGWDVIYSLANGLTAICLKRTMDGTEPPAIHITTPYDRKVSWVAACVEGALGEYDAKWVDTIDDPTTAVTPAVETRFDNNFLWLSAVHWRQGSRTVEEPTDFSTPFRVDSGFAGPTEHHTAIAALASDETSLAADEWVSNQVSPEANHAITSLIAIYPVEDYDGGNHLPDTSDWILHDGAFLTHHGSPVTYGE